MDNDYAKAISFLKEDLDYKEICYRVAALDPVLFCKAVDYNPHVAIEESDEMKFENHVVDLIKSHGMIHAIKWVRSEKGLGLKEAKDLCDGIKQKYNISTQSY